MGSPLRAILDTSVLIATDVAPLEGELAISTAALAELHFGVLVTIDAIVRAERLRRLSELQRNFTLCLSTTTWRPATGNSPQRSPPRVANRDHGSWTS